MTVTLDHRKTMIAALQRCVLTPRPLTLYPPLLEILDKSSVVAEIGDRLATIDMRRKVPLFLGELGPHLTQCGLGRGLPPCQVASGSIQPFGHNRHGPKIGGQLCLFCRSPSNRVWPKPRPTAVPSDILIDPTVWPQYTNVTDRTGQDRQYNLSLIHI